MFFVLRSAFWLILAYVVLKPGAALLDPAALSTQAVALGSQAVATQVQTIECTDLTCAGGKALITAALGPASIVEASTAAPPPAAAVPLPRVRPFQVR